MPLHTPLCDHLGIEVPILQAGMGGFAGSALAAAVSNAGGLGILAGHGIGPEELRDSLRQLAGSTDRPYGVNLVLALDLIKPVEGGSIPASTLDAVHRVLNPLRQGAGLPKGEGLPAAPSRNVDEKLEVVLQARIPVLSIGLGLPESGLVERCHRQGTRVVVMVTTVEDAVEASRAGVDAIVAQGAEAGGHRSTFDPSPDKGLVGTMALIPQIVDRVQIPVIAAGGIADGRGLVASLALGAQAVMMGTRFLASQESLAGSAYKSALLAGTSHGTTVTRAASGRDARVIQNRFIREYGDAPTLPFGWQGSVTADLFDRARELEDPELMPLWAGQSAGQIEDIPSAADVVARTMDEARGILGKLRFSE